MIQTINLSNKQNNINFGKAPQQKPFRPDVKVGIVDTFNPRIDINGDDCPDLSHGQVVKLILKSKLNFTPIIRDFKAKRNNTNQTTTNIKSILIQLKKLENNDDIKHVNISMGNGVKIEFLKNHYDNYIKIKKGLKELPDSKLSLDNISEHRESLLDLSFNLSGQTAKSVVHTLKKLVKTKEIFMAVENDSESLNIFNLLNGIINVGSAGKDLKKPPKNSVSHDLVSEFAKGKYDIMPVVKDGTVIGYDITEDGVMDVPISEITGHEVIEQFVGKNIKDVEATHEDYGRLQKFREDLESQDITDKGNLNKEKAYLSSKLFCMKSLYSDENLKGHYVDLDSALNVEKNMVSILLNTKEPKTPIFMFKAQKDGRIIYNIYEKNQPIDSIEGNSFATPTALAQHLNAEYGYFTQPV